MYKTKYRCDNCRHYREGHYELWAGLFPHSKPTKDYHYSVGICTIRKPHRITFFNGYCHEWQSILEIKDV